MYEIVIGRSEEERQKLGLKGTIFLGKHYVKMGRITSLSNNIYLDIARSHVVFVCGKRGSGKSYSLGAVAEGLADLDPEIRQNLSFVLLDTMGIYWTMKYPNKQDELLLEEWKLKAKGLDVKIFTPYLFYQHYKEKGIPTDFPFSIKPSELHASDWHLTFGMDANEPAGVLVEKVINGLKQDEIEYDVEDIIAAVRESVHIDDMVKAAVENRFQAAKLWGVFSKEGTSIQDLVQPGQISILDVSVYATMPNGWRIKSLIIGIIAMKLFIHRMIARKQEEYEAVKSAVHYFSEQGRKTKLDNPLVWLVIDEAHEFLSREEVTAATFPLITILREGREPGISLILASQQPGKIHTDVITQSDVVLSHRITTKIDIDALGMFMQSYMRENLNTMIDNLPRVKGAALLFDDTNERMYAMKVRPRFTWHGGSAPTAMMEQEGQL
ncbi:ATP-binding protein [Candidatus Woesearchaeota archaeon]|nr:ATP-binding protein [Candidatus Woesearchaeota archaeon]